LDTIKGTTDCSLDIVGLNWDIVSWGILASYCRGTFSSILKFLFFNIKNKIFPLNKNNYI
jgi:hypothetical protein